MITCFVYPVKPHATSASHNQEEASCERPLSSVHLECSLPQWPSIFCWASSPSQEASLKHLHTLPWVPSLIPILHVGLIITSLEQLLQGGPSPINQPLPKIFPIKIAAYNSILWSCPASSLINFWVLKVTVPTKLISKLIAKPTVT